MRPFNSLNYKLQTWAEWQKYKIIKVAHRCSSQQHSYYLSDSARWALQMRKCGKFYDNANNSIDKNTISRFKKLSPNFERKPVGVRLANCPLSISLGAYLLYANKQCRTIKKSARSQTLQSVYCPNQWSGGAELWTGVGAHQWVLSRKVAPKGAGKGDNGIAEDGVPVSHFESINVAF